MTKEVIPKLQSDISRNVKGQMKNGRWINAEVLIIEYHL